MFSFVRRIYQIISYITPGYILWSCKSSAKTTDNCVHVKILLQMVHIMWFDNLRCNLERITGKRLNNFLNKIEDKLVIYLPQTLVMHSTDTNSVRDGLHNTARLFIIPFGEDEIYIFILHIINELTWTILISY